MQINSSPVVAELTELHARYEKALLENDVTTLDSLFWDSSHAVRYGAYENLYGSTEVRAFRQARSPLNLAREILRLEITAFGDSAGVINLHFDRPVSNVIRHGRQTQTWIKFPEGWKIVSAHVSFISESLSYVASASEQMSLPIAASDQQSVEREFQRISSVAQPLLRFPIDQTIEAAPIFQP